MKNENDIHDIFLSQHDNKAHIGINCIGLMRLPSNVIYGLIATVSVYPLVNFYVFISQYCTNHREWKDKVLDLPYVHFVVCKEDDTIPNNVADKLQGVLIIKELWHKQIDCIINLLASKENRNRSHDRSVSKSKTNKDQSKSHARDFYSMQNLDVNLSFPGDRGERMIAGVRCDDHKSHVRSVLYSIAYTQTVMGVMHPNCSYVVNIPCRVNCSDRILSTVNKIADITQADLEIIESHRIDRIFSDKYDILITTRPQAQCLRDSFWQGCKFYDHILHRQVYSSRWRRWLLSISGITKDLEYLSGYAAMDYYAGELSLEIANLPVVTVSLHNMTLVSAGAALSMVADTAVYGTMTLLHKYLQEAESSDLFVI